MHLYGAIPERERRLFSFDGLGIFPHPTMTTPIDPTKQEHSNLWHTLAKHKRPVKTIDLPVFDDKGNAICQVALRIVDHDSQVEIQRKATLETDKVYKGAFSPNIDRDSPAYQERYNNIAAKHFLFAACRDTENPKLPFFPTPDHVGEVLTNSEIAVLHLNYRTFENEFGPIIANLSGDELDRWIERLALSAKEGAYFLDRISSVAQTQLLMSMASQLWTYRTDKSSPTSLQEEPSMTSDLQAKASEAEATTITPLKTA
jgi:hypothetical protein